LTIVSRTLSNSEKLDFGPVANSAASLPIGQSSEDIVKAIKSALNGQKLEHAYDAVAEKGSPQIISEVLDKSSGSATFVLPPKGGGWDSKFEEFTEGVHQSTTNVGSVHRNLKDLGYVYCRYFTRG
jgi:NADPH:quinone reductase